MNTQQQTLNKRIDNIISSNVSVKSTANYQIREAAKELEKLFLSEQIGLLNNIWRLNVTTSDSIGMIFDNKIKELQNQLNNIQ